MSSDKIFNNFYTTFCFTCIFKMSILLNKKIFKIISSLLKNTPCITQSSVNTSKIFVTEFIFISGPIKP